MHLLLIRHGESEGNAEMRLQGQGEYALTERGFQQGLLVGERLRGLTLAALYSSTIGRARVTAGIIGEATGLEVTELPEVREYDFGDLAGLKYSELMEKHPEIEEQYRRGPDYPSFPGAEDREAFRQRVCDALWRVAERHPGASVAVVTHAGPIALFCLDVLGLPYRRPIPLRVYNGSITVVDVRDSPPDARPSGRDPWPRAVLATLNDTCHLQGIW
jgi:broad specificity phosphatase PhoE